MTIKVYLADIETCGLWHLIEPTLNDAYLASIQDMHHADVTRTGGRPGKPQQQTQ